MYFAPRDDKGNVQATGKTAAAPDHRTAFFAYWRLRRLPDYRIEELYAVVLAEQKVQAEAARTKFANRLQKRKPGRAPRQRRK